MTELVSFILKIEAPGDENSRNKRGIAKRI